MHTNRIRRAALLGLVTIGSLGLAACDDDNGTGNDTDPPVAPTVTAAAADDELAVTVNWNAVPEAVDYLITLSGGSFEEQEVATGTSVEFGGLPGRTDFTASVVARNADGSSQPGTATATTGSLNEIFFTAAGFNNMLADPNFDASVFAFGTRASPPNFSVAAMPGGYTAATLRSDNLVPSVDGRTLQQTAYAGAIAPNTPVADQWHFGWTVWAADGSDSRPSTGKPIVDVGTVQANTTWTSGNIYRLTQPVFIGTDCGIDGAKPGCNAVTLTIEPGTTIVGAQNINPGIRGAYLVVSRGSQIIADATPGEPLNSPRRPTESEMIVFTSEKAPGARAAGDWGGLIINGQAPTNAGAEAQGEGDSGFYGGNDDNDSSGILRGVRIEFAGDDVTPADQLNGLALQGVGAGTTISYIQIHYNVDDGIEPFGGSVSVDHMVLTGIGDDSIDGTDGYRGFHQFVLIQQNGQDADQGMEISNNGDTEDATPKSTAVVANVTAIGGNTNVVNGPIAGAESDNAIQLREGTNYRIFNSIFQGFGEGFCIRDAVSIVNALNRLAGSTNPTQTLSAEGLIMWSNGGTGASDVVFAPCGGGSS